MENEDVFFMRIYSGLINFHQIYGGKKPFLFPWKIVTRGLLPVENEDVFSMRIYGGLICFHQSLRWEITFCDKISSSSFLMTNVLFSHNTKFPVMVNFHGQKPRQIVKKIVSAKTLFFRRF